MQRSRWNIAPLLLNLVIGLACAHAVANTPAPSTTAPSQLVFCHENANAFPWVMTVGGKSEGLDIELLNLLAQKLHIQIDYLSLPWKRCLKHLEQNKVDGAFAASFKQERLNMGRYPVTTKGNLNANKRIHTSGYSLYIPKGSNLGWNGETFINLNGIISYQNGFSIGDRLTALGIKTAEFHGPYANLVKVKEGRVAGTALQTDRADQVLNNSPELASTLLKYPIPISSKPYYLMLSFQLVRSYPGFADHLWDTLAELRDSPEMSDIREQFYSTHQ
ncbi:substrate-binding periplasmic protein [Litoribrevibacter euphylliae]|uniref:Substrate-binding periplasmic protein n=1 Tax=Litoribrevibacter euphylliae TaxID=1834034 RepID=A0ABV7HFK2_9GAMM